MPGFFHIVVMVILYSVCSAAAVYQGGTGQFEKIFGTGELAAIIVVVVYWLAQILKIRKENFIRCGFTYCGKALFTKWFTIQIIKMSLIVTVSDNLVCLKQSKAFRLGISITEYIGLSHFTHRSLRMKSYKSIVNYSGVSKFERDCPMLSMLVCMYVLLKGL